MFDNESTPISVYGLLWIPYFEEGKRGGGDFGFYMIVKNIKNEVAA